MTLTDDQLTEAIASSVPEPAAPPAWAAVVDVGRRQRRAKLGTATAVVLVAVGSMAAVALLWSGDSEPLETAAPDHEIVMYTERPTDAADSASAQAPAEFTQGSWRLMDLSFGPAFESATQRIVVMIDENLISVDGSCIGLKVPTEWHGAEFVGKRLADPPTVLSPPSPRLIACPELALLTAVGNFLTHGDPIEATVEGDTLTLHRSGLEVRAVRLPD